MRILLAMIMVPLIIWALAGIALLVEIAIVVCSVLVAIVVLVMIWRFFTVPSGQ